MIRASSVAQAGLGLLGCLASAAPAAAQAEPVASAAAPIPAATPPDAEALRAARLAADRERCEAVVRAVDAFGQVEEFTAALRGLLASKTNRFIDVRDGALTDVSCENWLSWNAPREGDGVVTALDVGSKGHPFGAIVDLDRQLRERGIDFLLVTFPTRAQLYPELFMDLPSMEGFAGICPATPRFALKLIEAGVEVLYLAPEFVAQRYGEGGDTSDQLFLKYNQHWAPRAAELSAQLVSERLAAYPWFKPGPAEEGKDWVVIEKDIDVNIVWGGQAKGAKPERHHVRGVVKPDRGRIDYVRPSSPITLLSGSFADFHKVGDCDVTSQLYRFTRWAIDKVNPKGGVEDACREELAARPDEQMLKKKIVIWMLPESAFRAGTMWRPIPIFDEPKQNPPR